MAFNIDAVDKNAQKNGVWQEYEGSRFLIASTSNGKYQKRMNILRKPFSRAIDKGTVNPEDLNRIFCTALSEHILLDWEEVVDGNGKDIAYTQEGAQAALQGNDAFKDFVVEVAGDQAFFETKIKENIVKK